MPSVPARACARSGCPSRTALCRRLQPAMGKQWAPWGRSLQEIAARDVQAVGALGPQLSRVQPRTPVYNAPWPSSVRLGTLVCNAPGSISGRLGTSLHRLHTHLGRAVGALRPQFAMQVG